MASSDSDSDGAAPGGVWPSSLTQGQTEDLFRFGLFVPPAAKVPWPWRISADGYPTQGPPATNAELSAHPGGRFNRKNRRRFWKGKRFNDVIGAFKRAARGLPVGDITGEAGPSRLRGRGHAPPPGPAPPAPAEAVIPPEVAALRQDGDPEDTPGLLAALAWSSEEAAAAAAREAEEASEIAAAIQASEAMAAPQAVMAPPEWQQAPAAEEEEDSDDVPVDWDASRTGPAATMTAATARA
nr:testis-specific gene A8 protein-like [Aegilops tauschii subsp. strangulata]XP_040253621.1 testis-specific gene A8 protein-like [Aegilops tauschii subsp. strangulata]XP_040258537.1 testis-specific gene A8 protein-like [Aegilops tauschii subsp. strangulata]